MRAALIVNEVTADRRGNLGRVLDAVGAAAADGAELVLLPEAAITGLTSGDDAAMDLRLGQPVPGLVTRELGGSARRLRVHVGVGIIEHVGGALYDSAVLLSPRGQIVLHYRRIHPGWHQREADPRVYRQGDSVQIADTPLGRFAFLICGDLFDDEIITRVRSLRPHWLLFPFARCFSDGSCSQHRWDTEELPSYVEQVRRSGCTALMVNYCSDRGLGSYFGGAMVVSAAGQVLAQLPLGKPGILLCDVAPPTTGAAAADG